MRRKNTLVVILFLVLAGVGSILFQNGNLPIQIPGMESTDNKTYDQADNERRNAEFLAAQTAANLAKTPEPATSPTPTQASNSVPSPPSDLGEPPPVQNVVPPADADLPPPPADVGAVRPHKTQKSPEPVASKKKFKSGLHAFSKKCEIKSRPTAKSKATGSIPKGKKLWVDPHDNLWGIVRTKLGLGYVSMSCLK